jgi:hypothetical protein
MATLQHRSGSYRLLFQYEGKQQTLTIGPITLVEARQWKGKAEHLLMRLKQRMLEVPIGCSINDFILHEGKPPALPNLTKARNMTLDQLREAYLKVFSNGAIESNTLATASSSCDQSGKPKWKPSHRFVNHLCRSLVIRRKPSWRTDGLTGLCFPFSSLHYSGCSR